MKFGINLHPLIRGRSLDKSCFKISDSNPGGAESYKIDHDFSDATVACHNQIFQNDRYI